MIRLHYYPSNASFAPHVLLHELGVPFERVLVDRTQGRAQGAGLPEAQPERADPGAGRR
jgi:glutathione S-transferase